MTTLLGVLGTQEIIVILIFVGAPALLLLIPFFAYQQGKKKGRLEGRLQEMERNKQQNKSV